jgi:predicted DCC family thiol-disulfide oxidoreductase YuxK
MPDLWTAQQKFILDWGWSRECAFCPGWMRNIERALRQSGFEFVQLQTP